MDETDLFVIKRLTEDARTSFRKIAGELGVSPDTVMNRYNKLREGGVIRGSTVVIDPKMVGYRGMAAFMVDVSPSHIFATDATIESLQILNRLIRMRNIIFATKTVGDHDLLAIGVIVDLKHLMEMTEEIARIPGINDIRVSFWTEMMEICPKYFII